MKLKRSRGPIYHNLVELDEKTLVFKPWVQKLHQRTVWEDKEGWGPHYSGLHEEVIQETI